MSQPSEQGADRVILLFTFPTAKNCCRCRKRQIVHLTRGCIEPIVGYAPVIGHTITGIAIRLVYWKAALGGGTDQFQSIFRVLTSEGFVAGKW